MSFLEAVLLGIVQGLTEFLPVSSSGHLVLAQALLGLEMPGLVFEVAVHVATLVAVCWVYRARLGRLIVGALRREPGPSRYVLWLAIGTVPAGVVGVGLGGVLEPLFERPVLAAGLLLVTGVLVWTIRYTAPRAEAEGPGAARALWVGVAQAVAILPGISRSGATVAAGTALGVRADRMAEFSFLLSLPAIAGAALLQIPDLSEAGARVGSASLGMAFVAAAVSGVWAIRIFVRMLERRTFHRFAYYCWAVGLLYLAAAWMEPALR